VRAGWIGLALALTVAACSSSPEKASLEPGDTYVAMGSSYAAGPGITTYPEDPAGPCYRSADNYAHQLARRLGLKLIDASCSGATTAHILGPRDDIPPQLDALTPDTKLVTVTIGGNDIGYVARLGAASCEGLASVTGEAGTCRTLPAEPTQEDYAALKARMAEIAAEVRKRSPEARLVFVDYLTVLPPEGQLCAATPLSQEQAALVNDMAWRLAQLTADAAQETGADILKASGLSATHDACSEDAWMTAYPLPDAPVAVPYHPNLEGMTAVANGLESLLKD